MIRPGQRPRLYFHAPDDFWHLPAADPALRLTRPLETGMVVTIEPGCYIIPLLLDPLKMSPAGADIDWQRVEDLAPHGGIRIEDNLCITSQGTENLTPLGG